jgi:hypothetical protein
VASLSLLDIPWSGRKVISADIKYRIGNEKEQTVTVMGVHLQSEESASKKRADQFDYLVTKVPKGEILCQIVLEILSQQVLPL